jgi:hypothetical protein
METRLYDATLIFAEVVKVQGAESAAPLLAFPRKPKFACR